MSLQDSWERALKKTEIVRPRVKPLETYTTTRVPYTFLAESSVNVGDTVVRRGEVLVEKPALVLPNHLPHFDGFDFEKALDVNQDSLINFFLVRGVSFPTFKYNNKINSLDICEGSLSKAIGKQKVLLQQTENVHTGLLIGPEECWPLSVLIYVGSQIARSADGDFRKIYEDHRRRGLMS